MAPWALRELLDLVWVAKITFPYVAREQGRHESKPDPVDCGSIALEVRLTGRGARPTPPRRDSRHGPVYQDLFLYTFSQENAER